MLKEKVLETIRKNNLIENGDSLVLGVSGGPDSISMLDILRTIKEEKEMDFEIVVAHINHGLRENAKIDEEYVKSYCEKYNIPFYALHADVKKLAEEEKRGLEETGRDVRYKFYDEVLEKTKSNKIAIAHNANDYVETIIMNVLRGSGPNGLKGIEIKQGKYIRPLLVSKREEIEAYCTEEKLDPRHDESNDENEYTRNKIRNIVIPYIEKEFNPNFLETLTRLSEIVKEEQEYLNKKVENFYKEICIEEALDQDERQIVLDLRKFNEEEIVLQKKVILLSIQKIFGNTKGIEKKHVEDMVKLCNNNVGNKYLTPNKKTKIVIKNKKIYLKNQN